MYKYIETVFGEGLFRRKETVRKKGGVFFMRRGRHGGLGCVAILAGVIIILSLILPTEFWWFILAAALIGAGIWYMRCC